MSQYFLNCFLLLIPILIWNLLFTKSLPEKYSMSSTGKVETLEKGFRFLAFILPLLMPLSIDTMLQKTGMVIYIAGTLVYFISWLPQIYLPNSKWSKSTFGFLAPAYTPAVWFTGIGLIGGHSFFGIHWFMAIYFASTFLFVVFHTTHTYNIYKNTEQTR